MWAIDAVFIALPGRLGVAQVDRRSPELRIVLEAVDQLGVGGGEWVGGERFAGDPSEGVAVKGLGFAPWERAVEEAEADGFLWIGVGDFFDLADDGDFNAEFFAEFADEAVLEGLAGLDFAAGKFPEAAEVIAGAALGDEEFTCAKNEAGGHIYNLAHAATILSSAA